MGGKVDVTCQSVIKWLKELCLHRLHKLVCIDQLMRARMLMYISQVPNLDHVISSTSL